MRHIAPSAHKLIVLKSEQLLEQLNKPVFQPETNDPASMQNDLYISGNIELKKMNIELERLYELYKLRRDELTAISESYMQLQQKVRVKIRRQQLLSKKHQEQVRKESV